MTCHPISGHVDQIGNGKGCLGSHQAKSLGGIPCLIRKSEPLRKPLKTGAHRLDTLGRDGIRPNHRKQQCPRIPFPLGAYGAFLLAIASLRELNLAAPLFGDDSTIELNAAFAIRGFADAHTVCLRPKDCSSWGFREPASPVDFQASDLGQINGFRVEAVDLGRGVDPEHDRLHDPSFC